eukprot:1479635-Amphidinium_carterae.1
MTVSGVLWCAGGTLPAGGGGGCGALILFATGTGICFSIGGGSPRTPCCGGGGGVGTLRLGDWGLDSSSGSLRGGGGTRPMGDGDLGSTVSPLSHETSLTLRLTGGLLLARLLRRARGGD